MATPTYQSLTATGFTSSADTTHTTNLPATVTAKDYLLIIFAYIDSGTTSATTPSGWTLINAKTNVSSLSSSVVFGKTADGTEGGGTVSCATSAGAQGEAVVLRFTTWFGSDETNNSQSGTTATGGTATPNPPSTSWSWGTEDVTTVAIATWYDPSNFSVSSYPSGYSGGTKSRSTGTNPVAIATAYKTASAASSPKDPGTFTLSSGASWTAETVVIRGSHPSLLFLSPLAYRSQLRR